MLELRGCVFCAEQGKRMNKTRECRKIAYLCILGGGVEEMAMVVVHTEGMKEDNNNNTIGIIFSYL